jgi:outer membrane protein assembly factor BamB
MRNRLIAGVLAAIAVSVVLKAEQWPTWRGPSSTGVSPERGLPVEWSDTQSIAWKAPVRGLGISSPIVWGDLVLLTSQAGSGEVRQGPRLVQSGNPLEAGERGLAAPGAGEGKATFVITALNRTTGRRAWEYELPAEGALPFVHEKHNLASPSPATDGQRVYAWYGTGPIAAVDLSGKLVWKKHLGVEYGPFQINWGHGSSPAVYRDTLILLCYHERASYLLALNAATGAVRWKVDAPSGVTSYSTPIVAEVGGRAEVVVNSSVGMSGHDIATGARLWHIPEDNRFPIPMPLFQDGVIYTSRGYRSSPFMAIRPGGKGDVSTSHVIWRVPSGAPYISSLVYYDGLIYMVGDVGVLTVTDAKDGARSSGKAHRQRRHRVTSRQMARSLVSERQGDVLAADRTPRILARALSAASSPRPRSQADVSSWSNGRCVIK